MDDSERRKVTELLKEMRSENNSKEAQTGNEDNRLKWMYKGPSDLVDREEYLLGKAIDKSFEALNDPSNSEMCLGRTSEQSNVPKRLLEKTDSTEQVDIAKKILEDPLYAIKQKEMEARKKLLNNPVKLKQIKQMLLERSKKVNEHKKQKSKKIKKEKLSSQELDFLILRLLKELTSKEKKKVFKQIMKPKSNKRELSSDEEDNKKNKKKSKRKREDSSSNDSSDSSTSETSSSSNSSLEETSKKAKKRKLSAKKKKHHKKESESSSSSSSSSSSEDEKRKSKRSKKSSSSSSSSSESTDSEIDKKKKKSSHHEKSRSPKSISKQEKRERNDKREEKYSRDYSRRNDRMKISSKSNEKRDEEKSKYRKNYGLMMPDGSNPIARKGSPLPIAKYKKNVETKTPYVPPAKPKPLSEKERDEKLKEMMNDAKLRKEDREKNLASHRKKVSKEEEIKNYDDDFMRRQMSHMTSQGTMADRIKSNINNIQRSKSSMDSSFMQK